MTRAMRRVTRRGHTVIPSDWEAARDILTGKHKQSRANRMAVPPSLLAQFEDIYPSAAKLLNETEQDSVGRVLYFPTYRRVERDLKDLLEADERDPYEDSPIIAPEVADRFQSAGEVVGFGGQDIRALLAQTAARIEVSARQALNEHSVRFLEVLTSRPSGENKAARGIVKSKDKTDNILARISAFSNSQLDVQAIRTSLDSVRNKLSKSKPGRLTQQEEMLVFYMGELVNLFSKIDELAAPLRDFSTLVNRYLSPVKTARLRASDNRVIILDQSENEIEPDQLSSGEKQILAFFAFLLLKSSVKFKYVIIDEPELSLSVSWQKTLIDDLVTVSRAEYVVAATHSPFIFERSSLDNVLSLGEL